MTRQNMISFEKKKRNLLDDRQNFHGNGKISANLNFNFANQRIKRKSLKILCKGHGRSEHSDFHLVRRKRH